MSEEKRRPMALGRGLSALLGDAPREREREGGVQMLPVGLIHPNPDQPRRHFEPGALEELAESVAKHGVLQPITVRVINGDEWVIVAGERRWRAAQIARVHEIPAIVRVADDQQTLELGLIENIQREQLNPVEEGEAYRRLVDEYGYTQDQVAKAVHKSRSHVANLIRLGELPVTVRDAVASGQLSAGHARTLIGRDDAEALAAAAISGNWTVRDIEARTRIAKAPRAPKPGKPEANADIALLERQLGDMLGLKVAIEHRGQAGRLTLDYATLDQLDMVCQRLSGERI